MKLSRTEINAIAQEFKKKLEQPGQITSLPKWKSSIQGKKIQKLVKERDAKLAEADKLRSEIIKAANLQGVYNSIYIGGHTLEGIYKEITKVKTHSLNDIENALVIACIDSKSVEDLMKKLEAKFKPSK